MSSKRPRAFKHEEDRAAFGKARTTAPAGYTDRNGNPVPVQRILGMERTQGIRADLYVDPASVPVGAPGSLVEEFRKMMEVKA